jgi:DNA-binding transcriptional MerR regulator
MAKIWTLRELAADTGVPERTIRFYISRELLDPPLKAGRGAAYGPKHKARLEEIRKLQAKGMMLIEIAHALALESSRKNEKRGPGTTCLETGRMVWFEPDGKVDKSCLTLNNIEPQVEPSSKLPEPVIWRSFTIAPDAVVMLRTEASPWRKRRLLSALNRFAAEVKDETKKEDIDE